MKLASQNNNHTFSQKLITINFILLVSCVALLAFYITHINLVVSREYKIKVLKGALVESIEKGNKFQALKYSTDNIPAIVQFADKNGMVEAGTAAFVFEEGKVARR